MRKKSVGYKNRFAINRPMATRRSITSKRPIVNYVVNAQAPKEIILMNKEEKYHSLRELQARTPDLRVMMVLDQFNVGGTETYVLASVRELLRRGIHVVVAGKKGKMMDAFSALGCPIYELNFVTDEYLQNIAEEKKIISQMKQILNHEGINIIHAHQLPSIHFAVAVSEQLRIPLVFTVHCQHSTEDAEILNKCNSLICVSPSILRQLPIRGKELSLIPNGVDSIQFNNRPVFQGELRKELGISEIDPVILYSGRLSWEKADICKDIIEACRQLKLEGYHGLHLLIVGEGRQTEMINNLTKEVHMQAEEEFIHLLGNRLNMSPYYSISDCVIGTGRTAVEALACCCPVIAVGVKGFIGSIHPGNYESAWDTWFGDHHADEKWSVSKIKESLHHVLSMSDYEKEEKGWVGRNLVKEQFNIIYTTDKLLDEYSDVLRNQRTVYEVN